MSNESQPAQSATLTDEHRELMKLIERMRAILAPDPPLLEQEKATPRFLVSAPVILRALASYLEVTGEAEKFNRYLIDAIKTSGVEADVFVAPPAPTGLDTGDHRRPVVT